MELLCHLLGAKDSVQDVRRLLITLFVSQHLVLVDTKQQFDIKAVDVLQQVLVHRVACLAKSKYLQEGVLALKLAPVSIAVTRRLLCVEHLVLLVLEE